MLTSLLLAALPRQDTLIDVLFGDAPETGDLDANRDGALSAADLVSLTNPGTPTPTPLPSPTATPVGLLFTGSIADFVPHAVGDQLVYRVTDPQGKMTVETTTVISTDGQGGFVLDDQEVSGQQVVKHETQSYTDTGSQLLFGGGVDVLRRLRTTCVPQLLRLMMPVIAQQTFSTTIQCEVRIINPDIFVGFINRTDAFTPIEVVDSLTVLAGTFTPVIHISGSTNLSGDMETDEIYIAPGVGAILQVSTAGGKVSTHELIGGTIGGVSVNR